HSEILGWEREGSHRSRERDVFVLLYVAAFVQGKNHRDVLELANLLQKMGKEFRIRLIGEGPEKEKIEREVEARGLASLIELVGFQNHLADHFFKADLAISISFEESMPNALVEAQYSGLPVVAYDVAGVGETFVNGGAGILVERGNLEKMAESIEILMADSQKRSKMSEVALKFSRKKFDPQIRFDEFSRSLLNQHTS
ncbi:MAG: glycosyltransferase, partial [Opitutales bacterium]|nr:glycosyltransferase [Opitutales bacterium]